MAFRTVLISSRSKLEVSLGYLVCRNEKETRVLLDEISVLMIESTAVSLTASLLSELSKKNISVIFCDQKALPESVFLPLYGNCSKNRKIKEQVSWTSETKEIVWAEVVKQKILRQSDVLKRHKLSSTCNQLVSYASDVRPGDSTNREAFAAKVYFNSLFGEGFSRADDLYVNAFLNYGYSILLATVSREIVASGFLTELGIKHCNEHNVLNLSCDFMEPFRPIVDDKVKRMSIKDDFKRELVDLLNIKVQMKRISTTLDNAIHICVGSLLSTLSNGDLDKLDFISDYEL